MFTVSLIHPLKQSRREEKFNRSTYRILQVAQPCRMQFCCPLREKKKKKQKNPTNPYRSFHALFQRGSSEYHSHTDTANNPSAPRHHGQCCRSCCQRQGRHLVCHWCHCDPTTRSNQPEQLSGFDLVFTFAVRRVHSIGQWNALSMHRKPQGYRSLHLGSSFYSVFYLWDEITEFTKQDDITEHSGGSEPPLFLTCSPRFLQLPKDLKDI